MWSGSTLLRSARGGRSGWVGWFLRQIISILEWDCVQSLIDRLVLQIGQLIYQILQLLITHHRIIAVLRSFYASKGICRLIDRLVVWLRRVGTIFDVCYDFLCVSRGVDQLQKGYIGIILINLPKIVSTIHRLSLSTITVDISFIHYRSGRFCAVDLLGLLVGDVVCGNNGRIVGVGGIDVDGFGLYQQLGLSNSYDEEGSQDELSGGYGQMSHLFFTNAFQLIILQTKKQVVNATPINSNQTMMHSMLAQFVIDFTANFKYANSDTQQPEFGTTLIIYAVIEYQLAQRCDMFEVIFKHTVAMSYSQQIMQKRFTVLDVVTAAQAASLISHYGSPLYLYKEAIIREKVRRLLQAAQEFKVCYAIKANTNSTIVKLIRELGIHHIDVVSPGEIHKALSCGYQPHQIMYTENFIAPEEIDYALNLGVTLNIGALHTLQFYREKLRGRNVYLRINPKVGAGSSYHVITGGPKSKFGIYQNDLEKAIQVAKENDIHIVGLHQHIGSNMKKNEEGVILQTMRYTFELLEHFQEVREINIGGGLGVAYRDSEEVSDPVYLFQKVREIRDEFSKKYNNRQIDISIEPGRYIIADSSVLLCRLTSSKNTPQINFIGTDTGFNHLIRPALYGSHHQIVNISNPNSPKTLTSVCGNICECTDFLGVDLQLGGEIGDILAIENAGAYGFAMSSNYNERPKPAEVMLNLKDEPILIRRRETFEDLAEKM